MPARIPVTFAPRDVTVWVEPGTTVLNASQMAGVPVQAPCGGRGICGACGVRVLEGELAPACETERAILKSTGPGLRLACHARVDGPVTVKPIIAAIEHGHGEPSIRATVAGVDLGTTSVSAVVVDAASGRESGRATVPNTQVSWGADVLSRVSAALAGERVALRDAAESSVVEALEIASGGTPGTIMRVVIAGNPAMAGLLAGDAVDGLAGSPFVAPAPATALSEESRARLAPGAQVIVVPPIASFVGGDALAGMVASGLLDGPAPALLVDVGTNAEVILAAEGRVWVTSAAAGPAFEAGGITCGGPAVPGGISEVSIGGDRLTVRTIGGLEPAWLTGAGFVSAVAMLRRCALLDSDGRLGAGDCPPLAVSVDEDGVAGVDLAPGVRIDQRDVRALQLAKGAVAVALAAVLDRAGVCWSDLKRVVVSGAFGAALGVEDLIEIGVIARGARDVVEAGGNTSLGGAIAIALDIDTSKAAMKAASEAVHVELAADPGFSERLMSALELAPLDD